MAAKKHDNAFVTLTLNDEVPETYEGVKARLVSIAEDFKSNEAALKLWYEETTAKLIKARDILRLKEDAVGVLNEKDAEIAKLRAMLEEANKSKGGSRPSEGPVDDADQRAWYEQMAKMAKGFHKQSDISKALGGGWVRDRFNPVVHRLLERGLIRKETGVKGPAPRLEVVDKNRAYETDPVQQELPGAT